MAQESINVLRARLAAFERWARTGDRRAATEAARRAFVGQFYDRTDPSLPEDVRLRQAEAHRKAHYTRMALRSAQVRRAKRAAQTLAADDTADA